MKFQSIGCIGGGRITHILLAALERADKLPLTIVVSDTNSEALNALQKLYPCIRCVVNGNADAAAQDLVFIALHPPVTGDVLPQLKPHLRPNAVVISLMPKLSTIKLSQMLGGFSRIVRMIPNAPAFIGKGFNPVAYPLAIPPIEKQALATLFAAFGTCPEVPEEHLEAYAMISAMGPTYLWFQLYGLEQIAESFGLSPAEVMDLVPVKPLGADEPVIREIYRKRLTELYEKLKA